MTAMVDVGVDGTTMEVGSKAAVLMLTNCTGGGDRESLGVAWKAEDVGWSWRLEDWFAREAHTHAMQQSSGLLFFSLSLALPSAAAF